MSVVCGHRSLDKNLENPSVCGLRPAALALLCAPTPESELSLRAQFIAVSLTKRRPKPSANARTCSLLRASPSPRRESEEQRPTGSKKFYNEIGCGLEEVF